MQTQGGVVDGMWHCGNPTRGELQSKVPCRALVLGGVGGEVWGGKIFLGDLPYLTYLARGRESSGQLQALPYYTALRYTAQHSTHRSCCGRSPNS